MSDSDASQSAKVKAEPVSRVRRQEPNGKRVSRATPSRRMKPSGDDEDEGRNHADAGNETDDNGEENDDDNGEPVTQKGRKRQKAENGRARPSEAVDAADDGQNAEIVATRIFARDPQDGYLPGSIVRICCQNFLTYDFVQFAPGPRMNMILGPNGTGKSTIACAICIGLGFPTSVLGRASELSAFIKHGYQQGYVEIELKGNIGAKNLVVRRTITGKGNTSTWIHNGKSSSKSDVDKRVAELGVQVGNLCSFLPQDRVNEFAKLKPEELLVETQKVAGHEKLTTWHEHLIEMGKELKDVKEALATDHQDCSNEEGKNQVLERDVQAFNKRKQLEEELFVYNILVPYWTIRRDKFDYSQLRMRWKEAGVRYREAVEEHKPIMNFRDEFKQIQDAAAKEAKDSQTALKNTQKKIERLKQEDQTQSKECRDMQDKIGSLRRSEEESRQKSRSLRTNIQRLKGQIQELENEAQVDPAPYITQKEDLNRRKNRLRQQRGDVEESLSQIDRDIHAANSDGKRATEELRKLNDTKQRRYRNMTRPEDPKMRAIADQGFMRAFEWLNENRERFRNVIEPACFSVEVIDPVYSHAVESCISVNAMKTFLFDNNEDYTKFNEYMDTKPYGEYRPHTWFRPKAEVEPPERSLDEIKAAGFDGYAIDFVQAPEFVKWFLMKQLDMHRVAVASGRNAVDHEKAARLLSPRNPGSSSRYLVGLNSFSLNRSAYGQRLVQNTTNNIQQAIWFTEQPIDRKRKRELEGIISLARDTIQEREQEKQGLDAQDQELQDQKRQLDDDEEKINRTLADIKTKKGRLVKLTQALGTDQETLVAEENKPPVEQREKILRDNLVNKVKLRLQNIPKLKKAIEAENEQIDIFTLATYRTLQATADMEKMTGVVQQYTARHEALLKKRDELGAIVEPMKADIAERQNALKAMNEAAPEELRQRVIDFNEQQRPEEKSQAEIAELIDQLEREKVDSQAKLDMTTKVNQSVIQTYEERLAKIERLKETIRRREKAKQTMEANIGKIKDQWLPQLNALIARVNERFSAAFDRINCAGEVRIAEHEDYDKWSIEILVKFRSNEPLQLLTGQRQSGGERSLTTILYLMSLTGLAKTPFALVDEINQGMDQTYERRVHNELIQVTCAEDSAQYFLITPKLLPNLTYHENVTTLVINNGDWLPDTRDENGNTNNYGDLGANLRAYRRAMRKA